MANEEHLNILMSGVGKWNEWRKAHPKGDHIGPWPDLSEAHLPAVDLRNADLRERNLENASLRGANLERAYLLRSNLRHADLSEADLTYTFFGGADLTGADLTESRQVATDFIQSDLTDARFAGADLARTDFLQAGLNGTNLNETRLYRVNFADVSLAGVKNVDRTRCMGPSTVDINTLEKTAAKLGDDEAQIQAVTMFLDHAGVPKEYIEFFRSRIGKAIEYYPAFISYSTKDRDFVDRLYVDLRQKNIRCWLDTEDVKIGEKLLEVINEAIRVHDKIIVVFSENSVRSPWVEDEVNIAFEKEREQGATVLLPIRLDDAVMKSTAGWAAKVRTRHIGDFRKWKDHDDYQKSLTRLIRDLQADS